MLPSLGPEHATRQLPIEFVEWPPPPQRATETRLRVANHGYADRLEEANRPSLLPVPPLNKDLQMARFGLAIAVLFLGPLFVLREHLVRSRHDDEALEGLMVFLFVVGLPVGRRALTAVRGRHPLPAMLWGSLLALITAVFGVDTMILLSPRGAPHRPAAIISPNGTPPPPDRRR